MKGKRFTDEQITYALRQTEGGHTSSRCVPAARRERGELLSVEEEVRQAPDDRAPRDAAIAR